MRTWTINFANQTRIALGASLLAGGLLCAVPALAQTTTATIRGAVTLDDQTATDATVTATNINTGFAKSVKVLPGGDYVLTSLPAGTYDLVARSGATEAKRRVTVLVAQHATLDIALATTALEEIVVVGTLVETRTSEVATNVTAQQIDNLPQGNRNFLNFASLAPGVRVSGNETRRTFNGGGVGNDPNGEPFGGPQVNVFIDGVSLKSNIQQGGVVGQDASRGNPFSQLAVQEFRVSTQQFKAEYEDAGTAIITAVTKSGSNEFHGNAFALFRPTSFTSRNPIQERDDQDKPEQDQNQFGASLSGPIIQDRLHFFVSYELNDRNAASTVVPGGDAALQAQVPFNLDQFVGTFSAPFREHLGFGKLNWQISDTQSLELTGSVRLEDEKRDFGGQAAITRATDIDNDVYTASLKHLWTSDVYTNEARFDFLRFDLGFTPINDDEFGQIFEGVIQIGGRGDSQEIQQKGFTFRDDFTFTGIERHALKAGVKISRQEYFVSGSGPARNPQFFFRVDPRGADANGNPTGNGLDFTTPERVEFGSGDPTIDTNTTQFGFYVQDDAEVTDRLTVNLGVRWDFETNANNKNFVTPTPQVEALRALDADARAFDFFNADDYISTGSNRDIDYDQIAPRIGASFDVFRDQRTVLYGGWGRYYDRTLFRAAAEESQRVQFVRSEIFFTPPDGQPRLDGRPTVAFDPSFLTPEGFAQFLNSLGSRDGEIRVNRNGMEAPRTDQWSVGIRQQFELLESDFTVDLSYANQRSRNLIAYFPANRGNTFDANGFRAFIPLINGFGNVVASSDDRAVDFEAIYAKLDKPYTESSGWGFGLAYTYVIKSEERGFPFNFDHPDIAAEPFLPNAGDEPHRIVLNTINDLPWGFKLSTFSTWASGQPFFVIDASQGFGDDRIELSNVGNSDSFFNVDVRLAKDFEVFGNGKLGLTVEVFNVFDTKNFTSFDGFIPPAPGTNTNFGRANGAAPGRALQLGVHVAF